jgi:hypothetical protein
MSLPLDTLPDLVRMSIKNPRGAAEHVRNAGWSRDLLWTALAIVVILRVIAATVFFSVVPLPEDIAAVLTGAPLVTGIETAIVTVLYIYGIFVVGQRLGGTGNFDQTLATSVFVDFLFLMVMVIGAVLFLAVPPLASLAFIAVMIWSIWVTLSFTDVLHEFQSLGRSFFLVVFVWLGIALVGRFITTLFFAPPA